MSLTKADLQDFAQFADEKLNCGEIDSLSRLADEWEALRREMESTVADIRQSHAEIDAGKVASVADSFANVRKQLGLE